MSKPRVSIIGGGIAGVSLGSELAETLDVTVLEAEPMLGAHATGRSAALFLERYGPETVRTLTRESRQTFRSLARGPGAAPLLTPRGCLWTAWDDAGAEALAHLLADGRGISQVDTKQASQLCPALVPSGLRLAAFDEDAEDIDVMALHAHYVQRLRRRGGRTVTGAVVSRVQRHKTGWTVEALDGRAWSSDVLVNAAGAWGDDINQMCDVAPVGLVPHRRTIVIARTATAVDSGWPVVADATEAWYFKPEGGALLLSPADETPSEPCDAKAEAIDVAVALERINEVTTLDLRSVQTSWAGLRTFVPDRVPVVGFHPADEALFCYVGQGGYGIQLAPALAALGAQLLRGEAPDDPELCRTLSPDRLVEAVSVR